MTAEIPEALLVLRESQEEIKGCRICGAPARWVDSAMGPDYWTLPCGHVHVPVDLILTTSIREAK